MLAVLKIARAAGKDYMLSKFRNKYGVKHWQHGIVKKSKSQQKVTLRLFNIHEPCFFHLPNGIIIPIQPSQVHCEGKITRL